MINQGLLKKTNFNKSKGVFVTDSFSKKYGLHLGDSFDVNLYSDEAQDFSPAGFRTIVGVMPKLPGTNAEVYMNWQDSELVSEFTPLKKIFISTSQSASDNVYKELTQLKKQFPAVQVNSYFNSLHESQKMFSQRWAIFIIVNIVILLSVMLGIVSVLANHIYSKRKEFAIIRTLYVTPSGILKIVITQILLYLIIGIITGVFIGVVVTQSIIFVDNTVIHYDFPLVLVIISVMIILSLIAFIPYGIKMSKRNVAEELLQE